MPRTFTERIQQFVSATISAIVPGTGATNLGKAEDAAHNSGDVGVMALAVRADAAAATAANGDYHPLLVSGLGKTWIDEGWRVAVNSEVTANDSDKSLAVTAGQEWAILSIFVKYVSTATVGDRQLVAEMQTAGGAVIGQVRVRATQGASLTYYYQFGIGVPKDTAVYDTDYLAAPFPANVYLPATYVVRVYDNNAVAAAADDMDVHITYAARAI